MTIRSCQGEKGARLAAPVAARFVAPYARWPRLTAGSGSGLRLGDSPDCAASHRIFAGRETVRRGGGRMYFQQNHYSRRVVTAVAPFHHGCSAVPGDIP